MNTFAVVFLCFQACLVQNVFSQCTSRAAVAAEPGLIGPGPAGPYGIPSALNTPYGLPGPYGLAATGLAGPYGAAIAPAGLAPAGLAPYGGAGEGNVAVAGELPVAGNTAVAGQVPIMGAVNFGGAVPAAGTVTITGQCSCGCGSPYVY